MAYLISLLGEVLELELELLEPVIESLDFFFHLSLLLLGVGHLQQRLHLGEQTPPLPVAQLEVALHIALDDADRTELLHALLIGPERGRYGRKHYVFCITKWLGKLKTKVQSRWQSCGTMPMLKHYKTARVAVQNDEI